MATARTTRDAPSAGRTLRSPMVAAVVAIAAPALAGWAVLFLEAVRRGGGSQAFLDALCTPAAVLAAPGIGDALQQLGLTIGLWLAMSVAMMLPTATAMVLTYAENAEAAARQGRRVVSPVILVAGYLTVWAAASVAAALVQTVGAAALASIALPASAAAILAGSVLGAAGLYQFSSRKRACLAACRDPAPVRLAGRPDRTLAVFRLGLAQGLNCLGCCFALMAVMLAVGAMNLVWMAAFSILMGAEKMAGRPWLTHAIGAALVAAGVAVSFASVGPGELARFLAAALQ